MHIPDGFLSPLVTIPAYLTAAPFWVWGTRRHFGPSQVEALPVIGSLTALAFVIQTIMIPIPGGTSTHLLGVPLLNGASYAPLESYARYTIVAYPIFLGLALAVRDRPRLRWLLMAGLAALNACMMVGWAVGSFFVM